MKKQTEQETKGRKLVLHRETLRHLKGGAAVAMMPTTPIGTCPESDPAVCGGGTGTGSTLECTL